MDNMLTLSNGDTFTGTILPNGDDRIIFVYLVGITLAEGFAAFSVPENIQTITERIDSENQNVYEGYTELRAINSEYGNCNITLRRP